MRRRRRKQRAARALPADLELVAVAPQDGGPRLDAGLGEQVVEVDDLVARLVADDDEHGALPPAHGILDRRADVHVHLLPHPAAGSISWRRRRMLPRAGGVVVGWVGSLARVLPPRGRRRESVEAWTDGGMGADSTVKIA